MNFLKRRQQLFDQLEENAALILFSGIETHVSADEYAPFEANRNFFYLHINLHSAGILMPEESRAKVTFDSAIKAIL